METIMKNRVLLPLIALFSLGLFQPSIAHTPPKAAQIEITGIKNGATVRSPFKIGFSLTGYKVVPAGTKGAMRHKGGHHHLLIDTKLPDMDEVIPVTSQIIHYGRGEIEADLTLPAGTHTLQLLLGDEEHEPHDPPLYSRAITITVE
jgi:hypothetical protein